MINKYTFIFIINLIFISKNIFSYEIIRDPIFEDYFANLAKELKLNKKETYLVENKSANAFVFNDSIYFTTGLLEAIDNEDTLKAIYLHEYGHIIKKHFKSKKIKIQQNKNKIALYNLFSIGFAVLTNNQNIAIGTTITLNNNLVNEISRYSVNFEIEADYFMIEQIKKNKISTYELISFLNQPDKKSNNYFQTHPNNQDRINNLKNLNYKNTKNSVIFDWIKSKYSFNSGNQSFNIFFKKLEKGIFNKEEKLNISKQLIQYEAFKKGIYVDNWNNEFQKLLLINNNSFLKIEYINYLLDNNLFDKYEIIEDLKFDKNIMNEYFYGYIYGKYYSKINNNHLSNFYFCQFYKSISSKNKSDFFCKKYDNKYIPTLDKSNAIFK